jgi:DNA-directed RNA polymerase specialized sigma24 family protein
VRGSRGSGGLGAADRTGFGRSGSQSGSRGEGAAWPAEAQASHSGATGFRSIMRNAAMSDTPDPNLLRRMEEAMLNIPKRQREIFLAHRLDDMSYEEIARRTGLTRRQVERHMARALYKLDKQLDGRRLSWWERRF